MPDVTSGVARLSLLYYTPKKREARERKIKTEGKKEKKTKRKKRKGRRRKVSVKTDLVCHVWYNF